MHFKAAWLFGAARLPELEVLVPLPAWGWEVPSVSVRVPPRDAELWMQDRRFLGLQFWGLGGGRRWWLVWAPVHGCGWQGPIFASAISRAVVIIRTAAVLVGASRSLAWWCAGV